MLRPYGYGTGIRRFGNHDNPMNMIGHHHVLIHFDLVRYEDQPPAGLANLRRFRTAPSFNLPQVVNPAGGLFEVHLAKGLVSY